jgi:hypothetical protein
MQNPRAAWTTLGRQHDNMSEALVGFFESLRSEGDFDALVQSRREEDLYLEFKRKERSDCGDLGNGDKKAFSRALSSFANADGGVLIFGVVTTRSPDGLDVASGLAPIINADTFRSRLQDSLFTSTQPVVDGVRLEVIPSADGRSGFLKCYVPSSDKTPHRAMACEREYWRRTSSGSRRMEHYELEDAFGRRLRPLLRLFVELRPRLHGDPFEELHFFFFNEGRAVARHAGFVCRLGQGFVAKVHGDGLTDITAVNRDQQLVQYYNSRGVIHANGLHSALGHAILQRDSKSAPLPISVTWYAEHMAPKRYDATLLPGVEMRLE